MAGTDHAVNLDNIRRFLEEDLGSGDITSAILPSASRATANVKAREEIILCGKDWFSNTFWLIDRSVDIQWHFSDGDSISEGAEMCTLNGDAKALLTGERTALNLLQTLSATATIARRYADAVKGTTAKVLDTRKTIPGLRKAQKYAVHCGGCENHRIGLFDGVLIKENHIAATGSIEVAVCRAKQLNPNFEIEVEVENLDELDQALSVKAHRILLDNFDLETLKKAVAINNRQCVLEASGNVTLENIRKIAETGVDFISVGALTKNIQAVDLSMRVKVKNQSSIQV